MPGESSLPDLVGDIDIEITYAAVGRAISRWEAVEVGFAYLYALFVVGFLDLNKVREFGAENRIFVGRLAALKHASKPYFQMQPNQMNEGDFDSLCQRAGHLSVIRNNIAHGIVSQVKYFSTANTLPSEYPTGNLDLWVLRTPWYASDRNTEIGTSGIGSAEIISISEPFRFLVIDVNAYIHRLHPLPPA